MKNDPNNPIRKCNLHELPVLPRDSSTPRTSQPLAGRTILITRPVEQAESLCLPLEQLGARALIQPMIRIEPPKEMAPFRAAIQRCHEMLPSESHCLSAESSYPSNATSVWLFFASANGVQSWCETWNQQFHDAIASLRLLQRLGLVKIAAIGAGTAAKLEEYQLSVDRAPERAESGAFAEAFEKESRRGETFWLVRADRGRELLPNQLAAWGGRVTQIVAYHSEDIVTPDPGIPANLDGIDWVTVTSSAIAKNLIRMFGDHLQKVRIASISPITSEVLRQAGLKPAAEATTYTMPGIVAAIVAAADR